MIKQVPKAALQFNNPGGVIEFARNDSEGNDGGKFKIHGYTGAAMDNFFFGKVIVDVQGVNLQKKRRASRFSILREHNPYRIVGAGTAFADDSGIWVDGQFSRATRDGKEFEALAEEDHPLEASISIDSVKGEEVPQGESTEVNGKTVKGPVFVVRRSRLREVSIVSLGADAHTSAIAAADGPTEDIEIIEREPEMAEEKPAEETVEEKPEEKEEVKEEETVDEGQAVRDEFAALCNEFGDEFGVKMFKAGKTLDEARQEHYALLKARVAELEAAPKAPERAEPVPTGKKPEEEAPKSFKAAWERIWADRNKAGEELTKSQAMKLAMKLYPDLDINS